MTFKAINGTTLHYRRARLADATPVIYGAGSFDERPAALAQLIADLFEEVGFG